MADCFSKARIVNPAHADNPQLAAPSGTPLEAAAGAAVPQVPAVASSKPGVAGGGFPGWLRDWLLDGESVSWISSGLLHLAVVFALSLLVIGQQGHGPIWNLEGGTTTDLPDEMEVELNTFSSVGSDSAEPGMAPTAIGLPDMVLGSESVDVAEPLLGHEAQTSVDQPASQMESISSPLASRGGGLEGRNPANRRALALAGGGSEASEAAVEAGLKWLAAHQLEDGSWTFYLDEQHCPQCAGRCRNSGLIESSTASTGLALLCFLGGGYTHQDGPYREVVSRGLYYLVHRMVITPQGGDLRDISVMAGGFDEQMMVRTSGNMYAHAIATLALCEAYAMTDDRELASAAQEAIDFIVYAQADNGGWRYIPKEPGDLSVTGWQLMALKSGSLGRLSIPRSVWYRASEFLDSVQEDRGANYGYQQPSTTRPAMTAVGLYGRLMLGWPRDHAPLLKGCAQLAKEQPKANNMYFNYYTSQVLHHTGGTGWKRWNTRMRNYLVATQADSGHEKGSWYIDEAWSDRGGRLYTTTLATLSLEVYYRYMPMYQSEFIDVAP